MVTTDSNRVAVDINEVTFRYGNIRALDGLSLVIPASISFGLLVALTERVRLPSSGCW